MLIPMLIYNRYVLIKTSGMKRGGSGMKRGLFGYETWFVRV
jgi:hypothetical protein